MKIADQNAKICQLQGASPPRPPGHRWKRVTPHFDPFTVSPAHPPDVDYHQLTEESWPNARKCIILDITFQHFLGGDSPERPLHGLYMLSYRHFNRLGHHINLVSMSLFKICV